jgi:glycosyltransferase involved in cell wall biosynthesis
MKILLLTNKSPWPPMDGGSAATLSMIKMLAAHGASVTVLSFNTLKHHADTNNIPGTFGNFHFVDLDSRIRPFGLIFNLLFSLSPYTITRFEDTCYCKKLVELLKSEFDIIQVEGLSMSSYLPVIRKHSAAKVVFRPHNVENIIWSRLAFEEKNILKKFYFIITSLKTARIERSIPNSFDGVTAISPIDKEWFTNNGCIKQIIVSSPVPAADDKTDYDQKPMSVCFIGALDWRPNINALKWLVKEVWPVVTEKLPEASLYIAGRNPDSSIEPVCRGKNIIFIGETLSSEAFLADKEVMAVPLFSGSGIRMKILEGMSLGKSIVATPTAAEGIIFEENKDLFIAAYASEFAEHIIRLLLDENLRKATGINARENVRKNYDIFVSAEELMKFYNLLA